MRTGTRHLVGRARTGTEREKRLATGASVVVAVVVAVLVGALAVESVHGHTWATLLVIVAGAGLGMLLVAALYLATRQPGVVDSSAVLDGRLLAEDLVAAADAFGLRGAVGRQALARWLHVPTSTMDDWMDGNESIPDSQVPHIRAFVDMATTLVENFRPERLPLILATRPVLMLGGRTYFQALNDGAPVEVVADSARLSVGGENIETTEARDYVAQRSPVLWSPKRESQQSAADGRSAA